MCAAAEGVEHVLVEEDRLVGRETSHEGQNLQHNPENRSFRDNFQMFPQRRIAERNEASEREDQGFGDEIAHRSGKGNERLKRRMKRMPSRRVQQNESVGGIGVAGAESDGELGARGPAHDRLIGRDVEMSHHLKRIFHAQVHGHLHIDSLVLLLVMNVGEEAAVGGDDEGEGLEERRIFIQTSFKYGQPHEEVRPHSIGQQNIPLLLAYLTEDANMEGRVVLRAYYCVVGNGDIVPLEESQQLHVQVYGWGGFRA